MLLDPAHQARQAAGIEEILHQIFVAGRPHIGDHRHLAAGLLEIVEPDVLAGAARLRDQMDDRIGRAAHRHRHRDRVLERLAGLDLLRRQILPHHLDDAAAAFRGHADVAGIGGRESRTRPAASCRSIRRSRSWSRRCPWSCRCRSCGRCRPRRRPSPCRRSCRRAARPSISRRPSPSPASCPSSCRAASGRPADRSPGCSCWWRRAAAPAWSCRSRPSAPRRRRDGRAAVPRRPSPAGCGRAWWSASGSDSDSDSAGSSIGKPPAIRMPRLTSSTRLLKCMWQGCASDQVLRIAITGRPFHSSGA